MKKNKQQVNLLDLIPTQNVKWVNTDSQDDLVTLLKPKFVNPFFVKYILPRMKSPHYKINLDQFGTAVWHYCDGKNTVADIGNRLKEKFGEEIEPVYDRLSVFIQTLQRSKLIYYTNL